MCCLFQKGGSMNNLKICGLQKTTLLDYPGHVAATVFLGGCNFHCPFCHNGELVQKAEPLMTVEELLQFLKSRTGILEGVCITGGEPTLFPQELEDLMREIKALGYKIKLDTNGTNPQFLSHCISEKLVDYIAMDVKASFSTYEKACGISFSAETQGHIQKSMELLKWMTAIGHIDSEFRTTLVKDIHDIGNESMIKEMTQMLSGAQKFYLQQYVHSDNVLAPTGLSAFSKEEMDAFAEKFKEYVSEVSVRGVA